MKILVAGLSCMALAASCSSGGEGSGGSTGSPVPASAGGEAPVSAGGETSPVSGVDAAAVRSPEAFAEYYRKLGVAEPVVDCYVDALAELEVTSLDQLETDQELGALAAARFDECVTSAGGESTETSTT